MKKICFVLPYNLPLPAVKGGAIETLMEYLIEENERFKKYIFTFICRYDEGALLASKKYSYSKFEYVTVDKASILTNFVYRFVRKILRKSILELNPYGKYVISYLNSNRFDIVINESADFYMFTHLSKKYKASQLIAHIHYNLKGNKWLHNIYGSCIVISNYVANKWKAEKNYNNTHLLYNGIDVERFSNSHNKKDYYKSKFGLSSSDFVVLFCGRIAQEKGLLELLKAVKMLNIPKLKLLIVGSSNFGYSSLTQYEKEVFELANQSLKSVVTFTGYIHNKDIPDIYSLSDVVVMPSIWQEPAGLVEVEAMASGKPVIATKSGGIPEILDSSCGILVNMDDKICIELRDALFYLYRNPSVRKEMGLRGREKAKEFGKEIFYKNFISIMDSIV